MRLSRLPFVLAGLLLLSAAPPEAEDVKEVVATGQAAIVGGNKALARDRALEDARRKAVEQACGAMVVAASEASNATLVSDKILTQASGYIRSYEPLGSSEEGGAITVQIRAKVATGKLEKDLAAIGLTLSRKGMPRLAVLIAEQRIDELRPAAWWGDKAGALKVDQRLVENLLIGEWLKAGFTFVDVDALAGKVEVAATAGTDLSKEQLRRLGDQTQCDVALVGTAVSTKSQDAKKVLEGISKGAEAVTGVTCSATLTVRAFNTDNGDLLATAEATSPAFNQSALSCGRDAMTRAARKLEAELKKNLLEAWNRQLGGAARVRLRVSGVDSLSTLNAFKTALSSGVRGVQAVDQKGWKNGAADLDVRIEGSADAFATELDSKVVAKKKVKVTSITPNTIEAELAP